MIVKETQDIMSVCDGCFGVGLMLHAHHVCAHVAVFGYSCLRADVRYSLSNIVRVFVVFIQTRQARRPCDAIFWASP